MPLNLHHIYVINANVLVLNIITINQTLKKSKMLISTMKPTMFRSVLCSSIFYLIPTIITNNDRPEIICIFFTSFI